MLSAAIALRASNLIEPRGKNEAPNPPSGSGASFVIQPVQSARTDQAQRSSAGTKVRPRSPV